MTRRKNFKRPFVFTAYDVYFTAFPHEVKVGARRYMQYGTSVTLETFSASGDIFSDFSSAPCEENRFWLIGTITIRFYDTREMLRKTGFCLSVCGRRRAKASRGQNSSEY